MLTVQGGREEGRGGSGRSSRYGTRSAQLVVVVVPDGEGSLVVGRRVRPAAQGTGVEQGSQSTNTRPIHTRGKTTAKIEIQVIMNYSRALIDRRRIMQSLLGGLIRSASITFQVSNFILIRPRKSHRTWLFFH